VSGSRWPTLPSTWKITKLKRVASLRAGDAIASEAVAPSGDYPVFGGNGIRGYTTSYTHDGAYALIGRQGALCGNVNYATGRFWASEHAVVVTPVKGNDVFWLGELLRSMNLNQYSQSAAQPGLSVQLVEQLDVPVPPLATQHAIADYLDRETERIDSIIEAKLRMVELLAERRVAAAHATITGVALPCRRRSSSVPWLGSIPDHWQVASLGSLFEVKLGRMLNAERSSGLHMRPYIRNINVRWDTVDTSDLAEMDFPPAELSRYSLRPGDLLVNEGGAGIGRAAIWDGQVPDIYYQKSVHRIRPRGQLNVRWLLEWMRVAVDRKVFQVEGNLATIPHVPAEALRRYPVPLPPASEANTLISRLDQLGEGTAALAVACKSQIALLQERRQSIITAAITGQLDVQEVT